MSLLGAVEEQIHEYKKKYNWGKDGAIKSDEFLGKFQTAFDPPLSFSENYVAIFFGKGLKKALYKGPRSAI